MGHGGVSINGLPVAERATIGLLVPSQESSTVTRQLMIAALAAAALAACHRTAEPDAGATSQPTETSAAEAPLEQHAEAEDPIAEPATGEQQPGGTACGLDAPCAADQWCDYPDGLCGEGDDGVCVTRPDVCVQILQPVCGCDGRTYGNACAGEMEGVDVRYPGECADDETVNP